MVAKKFQKPKSMRSKLLDLAVEDHFTVAGTNSEATLRAYAASIGSLLGRKYHVMKQGDISVTVYRYE